MELTPNEYLLLYALIVTPVVISFFFIRRNQAPTKLNLDGRKLDTSLAEPPEPDTAPGVPIKTPANTAGHSNNVLRHSAHENQQRAARAGQNAVGHNSSRERGQTASVTPMRPRTKSLNVFFQWNGHAWDAYEVLGIPAGSSPESAGVAYQNQIKKGDAESMLFFKAAYEAIMRSNS